jgi:hypothetical protein
VWLWSWLCRGGAVAPLWCRRRVAVVSCPSVVIMVGCHWGGDVAMAAIVRLVVAGCWLGGQRRWDGGAEWRDSL